MVAQRLLERRVPGRRLGRHVNHDPLSRNFPASTGAVRSVVHRHFGPVLDQGQLGSCTGNALAQALNCAPLHKTGKPLLKEEQAVWLYTSATALDPFPGQMPQEDTGSDGNSVCKAARNAGLISSWRHAFGLEPTLMALSLQPAIIGTVWTEGMDEPDADGYLNPKRGSDRGGHEYVLLGQNVKRGDVTMLNSWSRGWGDRGRAKIRWDDLEWLLGRDGDVTVPIV